MASDVRERWDATNPAAKDNLLRVVRDEAETMFALAETHWESPTAAGHWETRDIIGHLVDVTEGYLERFQAAREGRTPDVVAPLTDMAKFADERALSYRESSQSELLERLRGDFEQVMKLFERLSDEDWTNLQVLHGYMGTLPALIYPVFQLMDYGVHGWDIREGIGEPHSMPADVADLLAPFMFVLWQSTCDVSRCAGRDLEVGFRVSGRNAGNFRVKISPEGYTYAPGDVDDLPVVFEFDPVSLVLTAFGRAQAGTAYGDVELADRYRSMFFSI